TFGRRRRRRLPHLLRTLVRPPALSRGGAWRIGTYGGGRLNTGPFPRAASKLVMQPSVQLPPSFAASALLMLPIFAVPVARCTGAGDCLHLGEQANRQLRNLQRGRAVEGFSLAAHRGGIHPKPLPGRPAVGRSGSTSSPSLVRRRPTRPRAAVSCRSKGWSLRPCLVEITAPCSAMMAAHSAARSADAPACSKIARPPLSAIAYSAMIERHRVAPASRRVGGGSAKVGADPAINVSGSCDFLPMIPRANVL